VSQGSYTKVFEVAGMANCNIVHTSMDERLKLSRRSEAVKVDATPGRNLDHGLVCEQVPAVSYERAHVCASRPLRYISVINDNHLVSLMNFNAAKVN
jgi:hypothetical protein